MWKHAAPGLLSAAGLSLAGWMVVSRLVESGESPLDKYERAWDEDTAKQRFSGKIGDFLVLLPIDGEAPPEAQIFQCASTPVPAGDTLTSHELWSDAFADTGVGWSCPGQGVGLVNNE